LLLFYLIIVCTVCAVSDDMHHVLLWQC